MELIRSIVRESQFKDYVPTAEELDKEIADAAEALKHAKNLGKREAQTKYSHRLQELKNRKAKLNIKEDVGFGDYTPTEDDITDEIEEVTKALNHAKTLGNKPAVAKHSQRLEVLKKRRADLNRG